MPFSISHLHQIRDREIELLLPLLPPGGEILEIGAGTGYQAQALSRRGFRVSAIDMRTSSYTENRVFPVTNFDGKHFPVSDRSVDVVFSSNVLEHVTDLAQIHNETRRVLKPGGYGLHVMPTGYWRFWTTLSGWVDVLPAAFLHGPKLVPNGFTSLERQRLAKEIKSLIRIIGGHVIPLRHGESGNAITELWTFGMRHWVQHFQDSGFEVAYAKPLGLFYTGFMLLGPRLQIKNRQRLANYLGSACNVYKICPRL